MEMNRPWVGIRCSTTQECPSNNETGINKGKDFLNQLKDE
jgi:hypothetical protein